MSRYVPLSKSAHLHAGVLSTGYTHARQQAVVPIVAQELPQIMPTMVVAFVVAPSGDGYDLVALQSLQPGVNLYVNGDGRWLGGYCPAWYRAHPFRLFRHAESGRHLVCIDEDSEAFHAQASGNIQRLFDAEGEPAELTVKATRFLESLAQATGVTQAAVRQLDEAGVIRPWPLKFAEDKREEAEPVGGLFHIDEAALKLLPAEQLAALAGTGALSVAYAQLLSEFRIQALARLYQLRHNADQQLKDAQNLDLEDLFGDDDDDLSFDF